jgi:hypothetical protein
VTVDLGAIFLLLAVVILIGLFLVQPFNARQHRPALTGPAISALLAEKDRLLSLLQELDFDHSLGKIPAEEYPEQRSRLVGRTAEVLRQLDELALDRPERQPDRERLEMSASVRPASAALESAKPEVSDDELENLIARRRTARQGKAAGFCPHCGKPVLPSDAFCSACGKALK